jgi:hypothetical protein
MRPQIGKCNGCGHPRPITNKRYNLCQQCAKTRNQEKAAEYQASLSSCLKEEPEPTFLSEKTSSVKWRNLKRSAKPLPRGSLREGSASTASGLVKNPHKHREQDFEFYQKIWDSRPHVCVECEELLLHFSPSHISHHLPKGAYPKLRFDEENIDVLCFKCHQRYEFADRQNMNIYDEARRDRLIRKCY